MSRAEIIKKYLTVKDLNTKDITKTEGEEEDNQSLLSTLHLAPRFMLTVVCGTAGNCLCIMINVLQRHLRVE